MAGVLVFTESKDGKLKKVSREALTIGRKLAEAAGGDLIAFATDKTAAGDAGKYGAKKVYVADAGNKPIVCTARLIRSFWLKPRASFPMCHSSSLDRPSVMFPLF